MSNSASGATSPKRAASSNPRRIRQMRRKRGEGAPRSSRLRTGTRSGSFAWDSANCSDTDTPIRYRLEAPVSCATGNPGELRISGNEFNKYGYFREPLRDGLFSHRFENQFESPQTAPLKGEVKGNVKRRSKKGKPQINGSFHVDDWDPAPGIADCTSVGGTRPPRASAGSHRRRPSTTAGRSGSCPSASRRGSGSGRTAQLSLTTA